MDLSRSFWLLTGGRGLHAVHKCLVFTVFIPEQFTVKAHPALFGGEGGAKQTTLF